MTIRIVTIETNCESETDFEHALDFAVEQIKGGFTSGCYHDLTFKVTEE